MNTRFATKVKGISLLTGTLILMASGQAQAAILNVPTAQYPTIQAGINAARNGDTVVLADIVYSGAGNISLDFGGKAITLRSTSDDPTRCTIDCRRNGRAFWFHSGEGAAAVVRGITINRGYADVGGGIYCSNNSRPAIYRCLFTSNQASVHGGGIACEGSSPTVTECTFYGNIGYKGGAVSNISGSAIFNKCTFSSNLGSINGGGMFNYSSRPTVTNSYFISNRGNDCGGGIFNDSSDTIITNSIFRMNEADKGGGIGNYSCRPTITNCTFNGNTTGIAGGGGGICNICASQPYITNCILWGDFQGELVDGYPGIPSNPVVSYSNVEGGYPGTGNINANPQFSTMPVADPNGYWIPGDDNFGNLFPQKTSPCINTGNAFYLAPGMTTDFAGNARVNLGQVDMGAFEYRNRVVAVNDRMTVKKPNYHTPLSVHLNDIDPDNDKFTVVAVTQPTTNAWVGINGASGAAGVLFRGSPGEHTFTYTIRDSQGNTSTATVTVNVWGYGPQ